PPPILRERVGCPDRMTGSGHLDTAVIRAYKPGVSKGRADDHHHRRSRSAPADTTGPEAARCDPDVPVSLPAPGDAPAPQALRRRSVRGAVGQDLGAVVHARAEQGGVLPFPEGLPRP